MGNKQQESSKGKPSSAGRHGKKYERAFSTSANKRYFETKLRNVLRRNGESAAHGYASKYGKYGLAQLLDVLLASRKQRAEKVADHTSPKQRERVAQTTGIATIGSGGAGQGLPPITFGLGSIFAANGISAADFPAKRRKPRTKRPAKKTVFISPRLDEAKPDSEASLEDVLDGLLSQ